MLDLDITEKLLLWYKENARKLPWRENPIPYHVWVSEIMLQQTRVEAVKPYYEKFIHELPDVKALAECQKEKLLKLWEGLGYYSRVTNMQKAAIHIEAEYGGKIPKTPESLVKLPGIGKYTAGAIASIAYNIPVPAVDGNVLRVMARLLANTEDITKNTTKNLIENEIKTMISEKEPGTFNQALIELGALICLPHGVPKCLDCPVSYACKARKKKLVETIPNKGEKRKRIIEKRTVLLIKDGDYTLINKRPEKGLLAGMYELPNEIGCMTFSEIKDKVETYGVYPLRIRKLPSSRHIFTHIEWELEGFVILVAQTEQKENDKGIIWAAQDELMHRYPIPSAFTPYLYNNERKR